MKKCLYLSLLLTACSGGDPADDDDTTSPTPTPADEEAPVDLRNPIPPAPTFGAQFVTPDLVIPPFKEQFWCYFTRYDGDTVGIQTAQLYQSQHGHHIILMITNADEDQYPDGSLYDCTGSDALPMTDLEPIIIPTVTPGEATQSAMRLPEGMATRLKKGTRMVMQAHYVNTTDKALLVRDTVNLDFVNVDQVQQWASSWAHTRTNLHLPPAQATSIRVTCQWEEAADILYVMGHMHEFGESNTIDCNRNDGTVERIYEVGEWRLEYRDAPITDQYLPGEFHVEAGESFTTTCNWFNTRDTEVAFPNEMCVSSGMMYESTIPLICDPE